LLGAGDGILKMIVRRHISIISIVLLFLQPVTGYAGALEEYEEARTLYLAAVACTAAYSDRVGTIARDALEQNGWDIQSYVEKSDQADARFLVAKNQSGGTVPSYLLSVVGTENIKDVKVDLRVGKVYFAGANPKEFSDNTLRIDMPDTVPKVHKGFNQYVQAGLAREISEEHNGSEKSLVKMLQENKDRKVLLVGHSLGGAGVTIGGARLLDMGVRPEQVEVITFGAPAVGNKAFRDKFEPALHLTRVVISGDPVTGALQKMVGGYEQFGREIRWQRSGIENTDPHQIISYLDLAIKNFYQKRQQAVLAGEVSLPNESIGIPGSPRVYVAPIKNKLPEELQKEFIYMKEALQDEYRSTLPGYVLGGEEDGEDIFKKAAAANCDWVVIPEIQAYKVKNEEKTSYITLEQRVYQVENGRVVATTSYGSSTRNLTSLEALIHNAKEMSESRQDWLGSSDKKTKNIM
jgi:pimeloyl-ACP methyl ester carboxylesterase